MPAETLLTPQTLPPDFVAGNYFDKYRSRNPIHQIMVNGFVRGARELFAMASPRTVLEVGCGEGDLARQLLRNPRNGRADDVTYLGTDVSAEQVALAAERCPSLSFQTASVYELPFPDRSFDLVVACEVFEHLTAPEQALDEVARVTCRWLLISVPWEPVWRMLNCVRGKYMTALGNTPGHVGHFSRRAVRRLVGRHFGIVAERRPLPWTLLLASRSRRVDHVTQKHE